MPEEKKMKLIVSRERRPKVIVKPGQRLEVVSVVLAEPTLKKARGVAARLCGGTNTCLALIDIGPGAAGTE
ncbi:MAG: hypothetical protein IT577_05655 [Verrucomicrobiae bacterium]|nr:hypothetical protein [Verrucomicrobiae bacterium]